MQTSITKSTNPASAQHSFTTTNSSIRRIPTFRREIVSRKSSWFPTAVLSYLQNILSINDRAHELPSLDGLTDTAEVPLMPVNGDELSIPKRNNICNASFCSPNRLSCACYTHTLTMDAHAFNAPASRHIIGYQCTKPHCGKLFQMCSVSMLLCQRTERWACCSLHFRWFSRI